LSLLHEASAYIAQEEDEDKEDRKETEGPQEEGEDQFSDTSSPSLSATGSSNSPSRRQDASSTLDTEESELSPEMEESQERSMRSDELKHSKLPTKNTYALTVLNRVKCKLEGIDAGSDHKMSVTQQVKCISCINHLSYSR
jgi:hypothetical protein